MDGFKDAVQKLEQLRDGGFIAPEEFEKSKKELVDSYVLVQAASKPAQQAVTVPSGPAFIVKLRGIPFNTSDSDIINFFFGFALDKQEPVKFQLTPEGKQSGICFVKFSSLQEANRALTKNKQYMGQRYVEVFPSSADEMALRTAPLTATNWVRMRGLPFSATKGDILAFFAGFNLTEAGIFMVSGADGRASGEAFVQFGDEFEAQRALLKDKEPIGQRYIELFLSTREECDSTIAKYRGDMGMGFGAGPGFGMGMDLGYGGKGYGGMGYNAGYGAGFGGMAYGAAAPAFPSGYAGRNIAAGLGKGFGKGGPGSDNVVRIRGLPFRSSESDIVAFFQGLPVTRSLVVQIGGRPSGEAYVEFRDASGVQAALQRNRQLMGSRYIEVFPASKGEMESAALTTSAGGFDPYGMYAGAGW